MARWVKEITGAYLNVDLLSRMQVTLYYVYPDGPGTPGVPQWAVTAFPGPYRLAEGLATEAEARDLIEKAANPALFSA